MLPVFFFSSIVLKGASIWIVSASAAFHIPKNIAEPHKLKWMCVEFEFSSRSHLIFVYSVNGFIFGQWYTLYRQNLYFFSFIYSQLLDLFWRGFTESREVFESSSFFCGCFTLTLPLPLIINSICVIYR